MKNKKITLIINTAVFGEIFIAISDGEKVAGKKKRANSDELLILADRIFKKNKIKPEDIGGIAVVSGPGSFTAVRQGVVAANALGFLLQVPVVGIRLDEFKDEQELRVVVNRKMKKAKVGETVFPFYGSEPNITKPRNPLMSSG